MGKLVLDLSPEEITGIVSFLGYGNPSARVWFIGLEEGFGESSDEEAHNNLKPRSRFESIMDLQEAHLHLNEKERPINIETKQTFTQVWLYMAKIMLAINDRNEWSNNTTNRKMALEQAKDYVRFRLGRKDMDTFLTELSPIPKRRSNDVDWLSAFRHRDDNLDRKIENRTTQLKLLLRANNPPLVICYGNRATEFAELIDTNWHSITPKISRSANGNCLLLPFFGFGQMSHAVIRTLLEKELL